VQLIGLEDVLLRLGGGEDDNGNALQLRIGLDLLLDLNLPKKDGREVLQEIKADSRLMRIPVVVLTTSKAEEDVLKTYQLHANCYVTKPVDLEQFIKVVRSIDNFWLTVVTLPNGK